MSNYQVTNYGICGECKWHKHDNRDRYEVKEWYCGNRDSEYHFDYTDYTDTCDMWEQRGIE